VETYREELKNQ
jgi:hypothetical protein